MTRGAGKGWVSWSRRRRAPGAAGRARCELLLAVHGAVSRQAIEEAAREVLDP